MEAIKQMVALILIMLWIYLSNKNNISTDNYFCHVRKEVNISIRSTILMIVESVFIYVHRFYSFHGNNADLRICHMEEVKTLELKY